MVWLSLVWASPTLSCEECHSEIAEQWRSSRHAQAASNPVFQASWRHWPNGWCLECHAPREVQQVDMLGHPARAGILQQIPEPPPGDRWKTGVDCLVCHQAEGGWRTASEPSAAGEAVHALVQDPDFGTEKLCAVCHQFPFQERPDYPFRYGTTLAQATVDEWKGSRAHRNGVDCVDCHMGEAGHSFPGAHTPALVRSAVRVELDRAANSLVVTLHAQNVGHAVPTGDPLRRMELWLCEDSRCDSPRPVAWFKRHLTTTETGWRNVDDSRLPVDGSRQVTASIDTATHWRLVYRFGDRRFEDALPPSEVGYTVHEGPIPSEE